MIQIVFYSWQSDLPNACSRGFIQSALENAAAAIKADDTVEIEPVVDRDKDSGVMKLLATLRIAVNVKAPRATNKTLFFMFGFRTLALRGSMNRPHNAPVHEPLQPLLPLRHSLLQIIRGFANRDRDVFEHLANDGDLSLSFPPFSLIHVFTNRCNRLGPVTGVGAGSIDLMLEPWALG